ncbi:MAG: phosphate signaling complex protein PhoU [Pirellulaceae bacterium]
MTKHLQRDLETLHQEILTLSASVEEMIDKAARALTDRQPDLAEEVIELDTLVDRREVHIEEECLKILALHQPVAIDLRRIATVLKVNSDLERIADLAVNIAERAKALDDFPTYPLPAKLSQMAVIATHMVRGALDAFVNLDAAAARRLIALDQNVDDLNVEIIRDLQNLMQQNPSLVPPALFCFSATRHIERIADHATNIAEDVVYLVEGDIVRHRKIEQATQIS